MRIQYMDYDSHMHQLRRIKKSIHSSSFVYLANNQLHNITACDSVMSRLCVITLINSTPHQGLFCGIRPSSNVMASSADGPGTSPNRRNSRRTVYDRRMPW